MGAETAAIPAAMQGACVRLFPLPLPDIAGWRGLSAAPLACLAAALALAAAPAQALEYKLYGKLFMTLDSHTVDGNANANADFSRFRVHSNASRLGVRGDLMPDSDGAKVRFQLEYEVYPDGSPKGPGGSALRHRNSFVSLSGGWGSILLGHHDTPFKKASTIDQFNDLLLDIKHLFETEDRLPNTVQYSTPKFLNGALQVVVGAPQTQQEGGDASLLDHLSLAFRYKSGPVGVNLAQNIDVDGWNATRVGVAFDFSALSLGLLIETGDREDGTEERSGQVLSLKYGLGDLWALRAQFGSSSADLLDASGGGAGSVDRQSTGLGIDRKFGKSRAFVYFNSNAEGDVTESVFGVGAEVNF